MILYVPQSQTGVIFADYPNLDWIQKERQWAIDAVEPVRRWVQSQCGVSPTHVEIVKRPCWAPR